MELKEEIRDLLQDAVTGIRANLADKGINASGRTSESLRVTDDGERLRIVIGGTSERTAPLATLEVGRGGGAVPKGFKGIIAQWTRDKGISVADESHRWAIATVIARNIEQYGTKRHSEPVDVYSSVITSLSASVAERFKTSVNQEVTNFIHRF